MGVSGIFPGPEPLSLGDIPQFSVEMKQTPVAFLAAQSLIAKSMWPHSGFLLFLQVRKRCSRMVRSFSIGDELHHAHRSYE